jgi:hypothetical protein
VQGSQSQEGLFIEMSLPLSLPKIQKIRKPVDVVSLQIGSDFRSLQKSGYGLLKTRQEIGPGLDPKMLCDYRQIQMKRIRGINH